MRSKIEEISNCLKSIDGLTITKDFYEKDLVIVGSICIEIDSTELVFEVNIYPQYPLRAFDTETIKFLNQELIEYNHVMEGGLICIHTSHNPNLTEKLKIDITSLKNWIIKYYIHKDIDAHYEHIIVPQLKFKDNYYAFLFTDTGCNFSKGEFGYVEYSEISNGKFKKEPIRTSIVQNFTSLNSKTQYFCDWSISLKNLSNQKNSVGLYVFIENPPVEINNRFIVNNWLDLKMHFSQAFLDFLHSVEKKYQGKQVYRIPLFVGYRTISDEVHWQVIMLRTGDFPIFGNKVNKRFITEISDAKVDWGITRNCSYKYFFGRGSFNKKITNSKILIIGIGAIGSIVASTLTRGGSRYIDLIDYDQKEPENVCRSEYNFISGINDKVDDLTNHLYSISPFVEIKTLDIEFNTYVKGFYEKKEVKEQIETFFNEYDIIFDCSTDNDLMYVLSKLNIDAEIINFSITNHATNLVCGVKPNYYQFVLNQFMSSLDNELNDLYNPTGCWSPTFKASYNDINVLVQYALKYINSNYNNNLEIRNFVVSNNMEKGLDIKLKQY